MSDPRIDEQLIGSTRDWVPGIDVVERVVVRRRRRRRAGQAVAVVTLFVALPVGLSQLSVPDDSVDVATATTTEPDPIPTVTTDSPVTTGSIVASTVVTSSTTSVATTPTTVTPTTTASPTSDAPTTTALTTTSSAPTTTASTTTTSIDLIPNETEIIVENGRFGFDHMVPAGFAQSPPPTNGDGGEFTNPTTGVTLRVFGTQQIAFQGYEVGTIDLFTHNGIEPIVTGSATRYAIDEQVLEDGRIRRYEYIDAGDRYIVIEADGPDLDAINPVFDVVLDTLLVNTTAG